MSTPTNPVDDEQLDNIDQTLADLAKDVVASIVANDEPAMAEALEKASKTLHERSTPTPQLASTGTATNPPCPKCGQTFPHGSCTGPMPGMAPQLAMGDEELRERIRLLYIESEKETDRPVTKFLDGAMQLITQATERAEVAGRIDELGAVTTAAPHITSDWIDGRIKLLEARLRTLTTLDKEPKS